MLPLVHSMFKYFFLPLNKRFYALYLQIPFSLMLHLHSIKITKKVKHSFVRCVSPIDKFCLRSVSLTFSLNLLVSGVRVEAYLACELSRMLHLLTAFIRLIQIKLK